MDYLSRSIRQSVHTHPVRSVLLAAAAVLAIKTFIGILFEYQWYFPPDYENSAFLSGRRRTFVGIYRLAFYAHIISGPFTMLLGTFSILTGGVKRFHDWHRWIGQINVALVLLVVVPSGFFMALQAYGGPIAMTGFAVLTAATGFCAVMTMVHARSRKFSTHRVWSIRLYVLLVSPLLLRVIAGTMIVTGLESEWTYRLNAWLSWAIPLVCFEISHRNNKFATPVS